MKFIGITGGVGAGKSVILRDLSERYGCRVMLADELAHDLMEPGTDCYNQLQKLFSGDAVYLEDGSFDRPALARVLFLDEKKREALNAIVHPAVKQHVLAIKRAEQERGELSVLVLEAALLIEEGYDQICDELWYIYTSKENRRARLKENRGYSDEKIDRIFASQLSEDDFRSHCARVIDNNGSVEETKAQLDAIMTGLGIEV